MRSKSEPCFPKPTIDIFQNSEWPPNPLRISANVCRNTASKMSTAATPACAEPPALARQVWYGHPSTPTKVTTVGAPFSSRGKQLRAQTPSGNPLSSSAPPLSSARRVDFGHRSSCPSVPRSRPNPLQGAVDGRKFPVGSTS